METHPKKFSMRSACDGMAPENSWMLKAGDSQLVYLQCRAGYSTETRADINYTFVLFQEMFL